MKKIFSLALLATLVFSGPLPARADYDAALEAKEAAARQAAAAERARQDAAAQAMKHDAEMKAYRQFLGKDADGKTDQEIAALYKSRTLNMQANAMAQSQKNLALTHQMMKQEAETRDQRNQAVKDMTGGKSIGEIANMSDEELNKLAADLEKKYGN